MHSGGTNSNSPAQQLVNPLQWSSPTENPEWTPRLRSGIYISAGWEKVAKLTGCNPEMVTVWEHWWCLHVCVFIALSSPVGVSLMLLSLHSCSEPDSQSLHTLAHKEQVATRNTFTVLTLYVPLWEQNTVLTWHIFSSLEEERKTWCTCRNVYQKCCMERQFKCKSDVFECKHSFLIFFSYFLEIKIC